MGRAPYRNNGERSGGTQAKAKQESVKGRKNQYRREKNQTGDAQAGALIAPCLSLVMTPSTICNRPSPRRCFHKSPSCVPGSTSSPDPTPSECDPVVQGVLCGCFICQSSWRQDEARREIDHGRNCDRHLGIRASPETNHRCHRLWKCTRWLNRCGRKSKEGGKAYIRLSEFDGLITGQRETRPRRVDHLPRPSAGCSSPHLPSPHCHRQCIAPGYLYHLPGPSHATLAPPNLRLFCVATDLQPRSDHTHETSAPDAFNGKGQKLKYRNPGGSRQAL